jgi:hypothetical protein
MGDYDTVSKHLITARPRDWLALAGLPAGRSARAVDTDLSTIAKVPDKLIRVAGAPGGPYLAHVEFQAGRESNLDRRVLVYNVLAGWRHRLPVRSTVFLLRPRAAPPVVRGQVRDTSDEHHGLSFDYRLVRVWELPVTDLLAGGLGTLPLATVAAVPRGGLRDVFGKVRDRLDREVPPADIGDWWIATGLLMTLRYQRPTVEALLKGVRNMRDSWLYQDILKEGLAEGRALGIAEGKAEGKAIGIAEGRVEGERALLVQLGTRRFGPPTSALMVRLNGITDADELTRLGLSLLDATGWDDWLGPR